MVINQYDVWKKLKHERQGSILPFAIVVLAVLSLWAMVTIKITANGADGAEARYQQMQAFYLSEGAMNEGLAWMEHNPLLDGKVDIQSFNRHEFLANQSVGKVDVVLTEDGKGQLSMKINSTVGMTKDQRILHLVSREETWYPNPSKVKLTGFKEDEVEGVTWMKQNQDKNMVMEINPGQVFTLNSAIDGAGSLHLKTKEPGKGATVNNMSTLKVSELVVEGNLINEGTIIAKHITIVGDEILNSGVITAETITIVGNAAINSGEIAGKIIQVTGNLEVGSQGKIAGEIYVAENVHFADGAGQPEKVIRQEIQAQKPVKNYIYSKGMVLSF